MQTIHYPFSQPQTTNKQAVVIALDCLLLSSHAVNIPKMSTKNAAQAVTYALEDELLQSIEDVTIFPNKDSGGSWSASVVESAVLSNIKDEISQAKINCQALVPEFMLLPVLEDKISYIEKDELVLFRISKFNGGKIDKGLFFELYQPDKLQAETLGEPDLALNLFKISLWETYGPQVKQFKASAVLLSVVFILSLVGLVIENQQLSKRLAVKTAQNEVLFLSTFADIKRITDLPVELDAKLRSINKWRRTLDKDLLLAMSKHKFDDGTQSIEFDDNKLRVSK
ncbi:MAG: hypothetical protein HAW67_00890 [Endozoicomonadaceae bacterium]|nr:hypothetical protein [Endozoicomonadaceae bacterium]